MNFQIVWHEIENEIFGRSFFQDLFIKERKKDF